MNKTILVLIALMVICVSIVSAELGEELVTCWDFTCDSEWAFGNYWTYSDAYNEVYHSAPFNGGYFCSNLTQDITIKPNTLYNISINYSLRVTSSGGNQNNKLTVYLSDNTTIISEDNTGNSLIPVWNYSSFLVSSSNNGNITIESCDNSQIFISSISSTYINFISVKEVLPPVNTLRCELRTKTGKEAKIEMQGSRNKMIRRIVRWIFRVFRN